MGVRELMIRSLETLSPEIKKRHVTDHRGDWKKKKEEEVKKSKEVLELAKDEAKREQTEIEQKFDAKRAKDAVMDEIKENKPELDSLIKNIESLKSK